MSESLTLEDLGLPADRGGWLELPAAGPHVPGATLELLAGFQDGVAAPRRRLLYELRGPGGVVGRQELELRVLSPRTPIALSVTLPDDTGIEYELSLDVDGTRFVWPIQVPEQRVDARMECLTPHVRRGQVAHFVIHSGVQALETGHVLHRALGGPLAIR